MATHYIPVITPEPYEILAVTTPDVLSNCGLYLLSDIAPGRGRGAPTSPELKDGAYKALAEFLNAYKTTNYATNYATNYVLSDNILKLGGEYPEPRVTMDSLKISTGGFAEYLIRTKYGRITGSHRMSNPNHANSLATSIIQLWVWTPPSMRKGPEEFIIESGYVKREWLRGRERIFKTPEELKEVKPVSTKW